MNQIPNVDPDREETWGMSTGSYTLLWTQGGPCTVMLDRRLMVENPQKLLDGIRLSNLNNCGPLLCSCPSIIVDLFFTHFNAVKLDLTLEPNKEKPISLAVSCDPPIR